MPPPQAFISSYAPRLRNYANSLLAPVAQPTAALNVTGSRTTKRGTTAINYAEDGYDDDDIFRGQRGPATPADGPQELAARGERAGPGAVGE